MGSLHFKLTGTMLDMNRKYKRYSRAISDDHVIGNVPKRDQSSGSLIQLLLESNGVSPLTLFIRIRKCSVWVSLKKQSQKYTFDVFLLLLTMTHEDLTNVLLKDLHPNCLTQSSVVAVFTYII